MRRLVGAVGGLYFQATESERPDALREFGQAVASVNVSPGDSPAEPIVYGDWTDALERRSGLVVIFDVSTCALALISRTPPPNAGEGIRIGLDQLMA